MIRAIAACLTLALILAATATAVLAQERVDGHPLVTPYEGSTGGGEFWRFDEYALITGFDFDAREAITTPVQGRVTKLDYDNPEDRSELEIFTNYREALDAAGYQPIWSCARDGSCTTGSSRNAFYQANGMRAINGPNSHYTAGTLSFDGRLAYIAIGVGRRSTSIVIVETDEMDRDMVTVSAEALAAGLDSQGHVRVDGLLFAHDSDTLLPDSQSALEALRDLLEARPDLSLYVVGHTDMSGSLTYNMNLSDRRATSVVNAMINQFGIDPERLMPAGVGPLAPEASNADDAGRQHNRRVEIVAR